MPLRYDQDNPAVAVDDNQCVANIGKIFYRQCPDTAVQYSDYCEEHAREEEN